MVRVLPLLLLQVSYQRFDTVAVTCLCSDSQLFSGVAEAGPPGPEWPAEERPASAVQPPGRWMSSTWGSCSNPCGRGEEQRQVSCVLEDVTATLIVAADGFCAPPRPTATRQCYQFQAECVNSWVTGDWSQVCTALSTLSEKKSPFQKPFERGWRSETSLEITFQSRFMDSLVID